MLLALFVYFLLLILSVLLWEMYQKSLAIKTTNGLRLLLCYSPVLLFTFVLGLRYNVGVDYMGYMASYYNPNNTGVEYLYDLISKAFLYMDFPYYVFTSFLIFVSFMLFYSFGRRVNGAFLFIILFLFLSTKLFLFLNIQRQSVAFFILLFSVQYIINKEFIKFLTCLFVAFGFHYSSILFFPLYFILKNKSVLGLNKYILLSLFILSFVYSFDIINYLYEYILSIIEYTKYEKYGYSFISWEISSGSGAGKILFFTYGFILILYKDLLCKKYEEMNLEVYFTIFVLGGILYNLSSGLILLTRLSMLFDSFYIVIMGFFCYYLYHSNKVYERLFLLITLTIYLGYFYFAIMSSNNMCSPYDFVNI